MNTISSHQTGSTSAVWKKKTPITVLRIVLFPLVTVMLVGASRAEGAGSQTDAEIEKEVLKVEHEKDQAMQRGDAATLDRIYADELTFVNPSGQLLTKAQRMADVRPGSLDYMSFKRGDYSLHVYGDTAVLIGRSTSAVKYHGQLVRNPRQFMQVYVKQNGRWRMVAHHATFVSDQ